MSKNEEKTRHEAILKRELESKMLAVETWRDGEDGREAVLKGRWEVFLEDVERGLYEGDEGICVASVVGAPEHGNERVSITFIPEGNDTGPEVEPNDDLTDL